jgi:hypothetical protein
VQVLFGLGLPSKPEADEHVLAGIFLGAEIANVDTGDLLLTDQRAVKATPGVKTRCEGNVMSGRKKGH